MEEEVDRKADPCEFDEQIEALDVRKGGVGVV